MKPHSIKYWRFLNIGRPRDNEEGHGDTKTLALDLAKFITRIDMGSRVEIQIFRNEKDRSGSVKLSQDDDMDAELAALLNGAE